MIEEYDVFEEMFDRALEIAALKANIWQRPYLGEDLEYMRHDGDRITATGTDKYGEYISENFPTRYLNLGDKQITALEEPKFKASVEISNTKRSDLGVYIGLKNGPDNE